MVNFVKETERFQDSQNLAKTWGAVRMWSTKPIEKNSFVTKNLVVLESRTPWSGILQDQHSQTMNVTNKNAKTV